MSNRIITPKSCPACGEMAQTDINIFGEVSAVECAARNGCGLKLERTMQRAAWAEDADTLIARWNALPRR